MIEVRQCGAEKVHGRHPWPVPDWVADDPNHYLCLGVGATESPTRRALIDAAVEIEAAGREAVQFLSRDETKLGRFRLIGNGRRLQRRDPHPAANRRVSS